MFRPFPITSLRSATLTATIVAGCAFCPAFGASADAVRATGGMVVTPQPLATEVGAKVLAEGGNAVDAAVAVAFALAVTYPNAGNLGGGGFLLLRDAGGEHAALDFRETAPQKLTAELFLDESGAPIPGLSLLTGLAVGVPGSVAGLAEIHSRWGSLPWKRLVKPAIRLAAEGFLVTDALERAFDSAEARLRLCPETVRVFFKADRAPRSGERLQQPDLATTLRTIADKGPRAFYQGPIAAAIVAAVRERDGVMSLADLERYRTQQRRPVTGRYRGYRIVSFPPPSSGGLILLQMLQMLERFELSSGFGASRTVHLMAEIERRAFADRSKWLGDPDHFDVPTQALLDPDYLARRAASIDRNRATPSTEILPGEPTPDHHDTLHISIADRDGRAVAMTTTLNTNFGSGIVARGTGILLNNEMDDFALAPGAPNAYGLIGGEANAVQPLKRPLSSMTPTIVEFDPPRERPFAVLGSPGGGRIISSVFQVLVNLIDHGMEVQEAVDAPRFHHQWLPDRIYHEARAFPRDVSDALRALGHTLAERERIGNVNTIGIDAHGNWLGAADPRVGGRAAGVP